MKTPETETFGWYCSHADPECEAHSRTPFNSAQDAAREAINKHKRHIHDVCVYSSQTGYVGLAEGINFHTTR